MIITSAMATASYKPTNTAIFNYMGQRLREKFRDVDTNELEEIRLRLEKPIILHFGSHTCFLSKNFGVTKELSSAYVARKTDIKECVEKLSMGSIYAFQSEIRSGYITTMQGNRVGISGKIVMDDDKIINIKEISGLNFRFSKEIIGAADLIMPYVLQDGFLRSTLVLSPPQFGKTTLLRDVARQVGECYKTVIVDERCEIAAMNDGVSVYDLGMNTEVLDNCPKSKGIVMALRSLSPNIIITDELGTVEDVLAVRQSLNCGVCIVASMHAHSIEDLSSKKDVAEMTELFDVVACLGMRDGKRFLSDIRIR